MAADASKAPLCALMMREVAEGYRAAKFICKKNERVEVKGDKGDGVRVGAPALGPRVNVARSRIHKCGRGALEGSECRHFCYGKGPAMAETTGH